MEKKYKLEIIAGDFNSPLSRNEIWTSAYFKFPTLLGVSRVILGIASRRNNIEYFGDMTSWGVCHDELKGKVLDDYRYIEKLIDKFIKHGEKMNDWTDKNFFKTNLQSLDNEELGVRLKKFADLQSTEYAIGVALVILDFQGFAFVENNLEKILRNKVPESDYGEYYKVFTQPIQNSFAQDQEEDLLRLTTKYYLDKQWRADIKNKNKEEVRLLYPEFYKDLSIHTEKYCWVYYVYAGPAFTEQNFIDFIKDYLVRGINPTERLSEISERKKQIEIAKQKYLNILQPNKFEKVILNLAGKIVWAKPRRKDFQSKSYYHFEKLHREIARRLFLSLSQVRSCTIEMLLAGLKSGEVNVVKANDIFEFHVCVPNDDGTVSTLFGQEAADFDKKILRPHQNKKFENINEIKGTCACPGKAKGIVRIINCVSDMDKMQYGDILVSLATTPSVVSAMKKAAAIVTDEGGLTCHASIVSRELNIPCVIGTKFATQVLKDGQMVEVDAQKGLIKIINK